MDKVARLLEEITRLGMTTAVESGRLRISAPKSSLTGELQRRIAECKDEIIRRVADVSSDGSRGSGDGLTQSPEADCSAFPLSDLQLGFYIANDSYMEFHVRPHCYFEYDVAHLDPVTYEAAWNKALKRRRRELCTVTKDLELRLLAGEVTIRCQVYDLRNVTTEDVSKHLLRVREAMQRSELPLETWPWLDLRISLWKEGGSEIGRIHYNHNNFFVDGFGTNQLLHEIDEYYAHPHLTYPPLTLSYRDAVLDLKRLSESEQGEAAYTYWISRLPALPTPPNLPQTPDLNRRCRSRLERRDGELEKALWVNFKSRAATLGITPNNAMIATYAYIVATWSNSDHFIFSQMATRRFADLHPDLPLMLGNFASLYPLEIKLIPSASFADNARRIQRQVMEDMQHLQIGGMRVLQELNRLKGSFGSAPSPFVVGSGLSLKKFKKATFTLLETSQTVLDYQFFELEDGSCYYVWDLLEMVFPEGMVDAMWGAFQRLLVLLASDGSAWQRAEFDLLDQHDLEERRDQNKTECAIPGSGLHEALSREAFLQPESIILQSAQGPLSYRSLYSESNALAAELRLRGVKKGDLVPVVMDRDHELLVAVLAILRSGAAYVPIDPGLPRDRLTLLLVDTGSRLVLTQKKFAETLAWPEGATTLCVLLHGAETSAATSDIDAGNLDLAYMIYTSGSTGTPKGVMIQHRAALNTILDINQRFGVGPADKLFGVSAFNFDLSVYDIFGAIAAGACLVYPNPESAQDPTHWLERTAQENVTIWNSVPALMRLLVESAERRKVQMPSLRLVMLSGDKIPLDLPDAIRRVAPNCEIVSLGGATEASIWSILYPIEQVTPGWATIPYGYPMRNQRWFIRDRNEKDCATWVPGELLIGGIGLAQGYWQDSAKTEHAFCMDGRTGERLYRTGDLGRYRPGGCIEWMGRIDFQVKIQGQRVELGEIEAVLTKHPDVAQALVSLDEGARKGEQRLTAYIVSRGRRPIDVQRLESYLLNKLPSHMVPTAWLTLDELPLSANGKVDRKSLPKLVSTTDPSSLSKPEYVPPSNAIEEKLKDIWEKTLGISRIGVTDDFFELGGQSFDAIRIFALVKDELGRTYSLSDIWRARNIRELARGITDVDEPLPSRNVVPINLRSSGEPLFLVHPAGGSVMAYSALGELIDRPLYGIQAEPRTGHPDEQGLDIVELARSYVSEVRQCQPRGPYFLGGWSSGAMIAFEMAAQLLASGESVSHVYILDGPTPVASAEVGDESLLRWFLQDLALGLPVERMDKEIFTGLNPKQQLTKAAKLLGAEEQFGPGVEALIESFRFFRDLLRAASRHSPGNLSCDVTVVRVEKEIVDEFSIHPNRNESDWGWGRFTSGKLRCIQVPGTHHTFLKRPLVEDWCDLMGDKKLAVAGEA